MKSISIIIPNYNGADLLKKNLPSVYQALFDSEIKDYEIIVADDASTDNSIFFLENKYPKIIIVKNKINKGFSGNTNSGIRIAKKQLVFILNSDVKLLGNYFAPLLKYFDKEDTFGVMGRIISMKNDKIQDSGKYPYYSFGKIKSGKNYLAENKDFQYSFFLSGANSLVDRQKLLALGGFNELFNPYYFEDIDLGLTAWRSGYRLYYEHNSICRHPNSTTIKKQPSQKIKLVVQLNKIKLHFLHLNGIELYFYLCVLFLKSFFSLFFLKTIYIKSIFLFLNSLKKLSKQKKHKKIIRKKSVAKISRFIKSDIENSDINIF